MGQPLVSVVMPAYNAEKTIGESIESVLYQTYQNWELLIIDDCSLDQTYMIAEQMSVENPRIRLIKNECNLGVSETRNRAIGSAKGAWIAFLDSDDRWEADKLQKQMDYVIQNQKADLVFTGSAFIDYQGKIFDYKLEVPEQISFKELLKQNVISCSSVLIRKMWLVKYPMKYDQMHEDYAVWLQVLRDGGRAFGINEPLLIYRLSSNSKSSNKSKAAVMTYRVYRYLGLNHMQAIYYFCWYAWKNIKKYRAIFQ